MLEQFIPNIQLEILQDTDCEEAEHFQRKLAEITKVIDTMPKTYETEGQDDNAIIYLHYFNPVGDVWVTEKDINPGQNQAFGYIDIGMGGELGYVCIAELIHNGFELDLYWTPTALKNIK